MTNVNSAVKAFSPGLKSRQLFLGDQPAALADIYHDEANIVVWQRELANELTQSAAHVVRTMPTLQAAATVTSKNLGDYLSDVFGIVNEVSALKEDIVKLVDMFLLLFELEHAGLRVSVLDRAMCPRFHVDRIPCRLVTTYLGTATEWLSHNSLDRSKLGSGNQGRSDEQSGLFESIDDIQCLRNGDVALLKGELWQGNEDAGLVHRSPQLGREKSRLLLTIDLAD